MPVSARFLPVLLPFVAATALAAQSERPPEQFQLALGMQQRGLHEEAAQYLTEFLRGNARHPLAAEAHYRLGTSLLELKRPNDAVAALRAALEKGGADFRLRPECRYRLGTTWKEQKQFAEAAAQLAALAREVAADHYLLAPARYAEGECWRDLKDDPKAVVAFDAAAAAAKGEQASYRFPALYQAGFARVRTAAYAEAAVTFDAAATAAGDEAAKGECRYLAGDAALRAKDLDKAVQCFTQAARLPGEFADDAAFGLGWVAVERGDAKAAQQAFRFVADKHPDSPLAPRALLEVGRIQYRDKQFGAASRTLEPLLGAAAPEDVRKQAQELAGLCALELGEGDEALNRLRAAAAAASPADKPRLAWSLGEALAAQGKWKEALAAYEQVPANAPPELRGDALYGACFALHKLGKHEESSKRAAALRQLEPPHRLRPQATFAIAENLYAQQKYADAAVEYGAVDGNPETKRKAVWKLAWCAYLRGDKAGAADRFAAIAALENDAFREEAQSMTALALLESGKNDEALQAADAYRARFSKGGYLDRTERVAARVLRQRGDLTGASQRLANAAAASKGTGGAGDVLEQAELAYQQGDFKTAQEHYGKAAAAKDRTGARAMEGLAWCAFELGDDAACKRHLDGALQHPAGKDLEPSLLELRSALQHRQKDWAGAIATAQQFLAAYGKSPKAPAMRYALGTAQARAEDFANARKTLEALARDGGHPRLDLVQYECAWACRRSGDEPAALAAFGVVAAQSQDPELRGEAQLHLGTAALDRGDEKAGRELLAQVKGKHEARALYRLGFLDLDAAKDDPARLARAKTVFAAIAALPDEPLAPEAEFLAGECCFRAGDHAGAAERFRALLAKAPNHERAATARLQLGECGVVLGTADEAVRALEEYLRGKPGERSDQARAHLALGRARLLRKEHERAEAAFSKTTELSEGPLAAEAQFRLGESRALRGDLDGAADAFVKLPILYAHEEWVRRGLLQSGLVYEQLRQPQKAKRFYEELLKRFPDSREGQEAQSRLRGV